MIYQLTEFLSDDDFDLMLREVDKFLYDEDRPGWKFNGHSKDEDRDKPFWYCPVNSDYYFSDVLWKGVQKTIKDISGDDVEMDTVYLNGATFGQQGYWHMDDQSDDSSRTFLIYANKTWDPEWSGATVFKHPDTGQIETIYPSPKQAVYFHGMIPHFSQSLTRDFYGIRVTVAYKMYLK